MSQLYKTAYHIRVTWPEGCVGAPKTIVVRKGGNFEKILNNLMTRDGKLSPEEAETIINNMTEEERHAKYVQLNTHFWLDPETPVYPLTAECFELIDGHALPSMLAGGGAPRQLKADTLPKLKKSEITGE